MRAGPGWRGQLRDCPRMDPLTPLEAVRATSGAVHDLGGRFMASRSTFRRGAGMGMATRAELLRRRPRRRVGRRRRRRWSRPRSGWFNPAAVLPNWEAGVAVAGARGAARRYNEAAALWGRDRLTGVDGIDRLAELAERLVGGRGHCGAAAVRRLAGRAPGRRPRRARRADHPRAARVAGRQPPDRHHCGGAQPARGDPHQRRREQAAGVRVGGAVPRLQRPPRRARGGGGD